MFSNQTTEHKPILSKRAFWDTDLHSLDFDRYHQFIIIRVFERGSSADKEAIITYYSKEKIIDTLRNAASLLPIAREWAKQLFHLSDEDFTCYTNKQPARNFSRY